MEAELSRLRELKAKLELEKLQREIRDLGGDPSAPPEAERPEEGRKKAKKDRKGKKDKKRLEAEVHVPSPAQSRSPSCRPSPAKRARSGQRPSGEKGKGAASLKPAGAQREEEQPQTPSSGSLAFYEEWSKELDMNCMKIQHEEPNGNTYRYWRLVDPSTGFAVVPTVQSEQSQSQNQPGSSHWESWEEPATEWGHTQKWQNQEAKEKWTGWSTDWAEDRWDKQPRKARFLRAVPPETEGPVALVCKFQKSKKGCQHGKWCNFIHDGSWRGCFMEAKRPGNCKWGEECRFSHTNTVGSPARSPRRDRSRDASQSSSAGGAEADRDPAVVQSNPQAVKEEQPDSDDQALPLSSTPRPGETPAAPAVSAPPAHWEKARAAVLGAAKASELRALQHSERAVAASSIVRDTIMNGILENPTRTEEAQKPLQENQKK